MFSDLTATRQHYVWLTPRRWQPSPDLTGGSVPSTSLGVPWECWEAMGRPPNIEAIYEAQACRKDIVNDHANRT
jgi:hypothetical protein